MRFKVPRLGKKCVVDLVYYKKKNGKHTAYQEVTFLFFFLFLTVINNVSPFGLLVSSSFRKR